MRWLVSIDTGSPSETSAAVAYSCASLRASSTAREEAQLYATAADVSLGDPVSIETSQRNVSPHRAFELSATSGDAGAPTTELETGQVTVTATATIEYEFTAGEEGE